VRTHVVRAYAIDRTRHAILIAVELVEKFLLIAEVDELVEGLELAYFDDFALVAVCGERLRLGNGNLAYRIVEPASGNPRATHHKRSDGEASAGDSETFAILCGAVLYAFGAVGLCASEQVLERIALVIGYSVGIKVTGGDAGARGRDRGL